jgi:hypothetical protein
MRRGRRSLAGPFVHLAPRVGRRGNGRDRARAMLRYAACAVGASTGSTGAGPQT